MNLHEIHAAIKKLTAKKLGKPNQVKDYEGTIDDSIFGSKVKVKAKSQSSAEKKVKKMASYKDRNSGLKRTWPSQTSEVPKYQDVRDTYKKHEIKEETQIEKGVKDEMEHTKSKAVAKKIAKDHLKKHSDYYSKLEKAGLSEGIKEKIKGIIRREKQKDIPIIQNRRDYAKGKAYDSYVKGDKKNGDRYMAWRKKSLTKAGLDEATLGGAKLAGKENPNNVKSKKSGFTINTKMNDAYSKVPDAKGLVRKRLLQKGKAAWNVGHAKKLAEEENLQELSSDKLKSYVDKAVKSRDTNDKKAKEHAWRANDAGTIKTLSKHIGKRDQAEKKVANRDKGIKTAKDKIWRKKVQKEYDGPNREGKSASDGVRYTGD
jgi:hypothetical protein